MIRELAENPNVHQSLSPSRELVTDPDGRFAIYLMPGAAPEAATVHEPTLTEIRALLRRRGREGAEWELGESCTPPDLVDRMLELGLQRIDSDPVAVGMVLHGRPARKSPSGVVANGSASSLSPASTA